MERKAKRNCALSVRCRYVARQIHRSPGRGLLALLVAAVLLFGLCYLQESILSAGNGAALLHHRSWWADSP